MSQPSRVAEYNFALMVLEHAVRAEGPADVRLEAARGLILAHALPMDAVDREEVIDARSDVLELIQDALEAPAGGTEVLTRVYVEVYRLAVAVER